MAELVYKPVIRLALGAFRVMDVRFDLRGAEHIPRTGGAVLASNHISYLDFLFCGWAAHPSRRMVRFMAKKSVFGHPLSGPLMRGMRHIPVDRSAGAHAFDVAKAALRAGEVIGVFPEATVSRSLQLSTFKSGAARLAAGAAVPLIPMAVWGGQRLWTKGRPRTLRRRHVPVLVRVGAPLHPSPDDDYDTVTAQLRERIAELLATAMAEYPDRPAGPEDAWWLPANAGGTAPTREQAAQLDRPGEAPAA